MNTRAPLTLAHIQDIDVSVEQRMDRLKTAFQELFQSDAVDTVYAPGRAEILGNHTDYNQGYTLSANVNANILLVAQRRDDQRVRIQSLNQDDGVMEFDASSAEVLLTNRQDEAWVSYVQGVLWAFLQDGRPISGFDAVLHSTIPSGGGLSSSAALETAIARLTCLYTDRDVSPVEQVVLCKHAENDFVGAPCGYLDQATVGLSQSWLYMHYIPEGDQPFRYDPINGDLDRYDVRLVAGFDPDSKHALVDGKYAVRQQACFSSLSVFQDVLQRPINSLTDVSVREFERTLSDLYRVLPSETIDRVGHVIYENQRVLDGVQTLQSGNITRFGELMTHSGCSALDLYTLDEDAPELRFVVEAIRSLGYRQGVLGVRNMGGGFNATTLSLVRASHLDAFQETIQQRYHQQYGRPYSFVPFLPSPAASVLQ